MRVAIDTGGTFTDCIYLEDSTLEIRKVLSTPQDPAQAITDALDQAGLTPKHTAPIELLHGTTVGTNALLTRRGARIALVTTAGFEDVLVIGRQARENLYDLGFVRPPSLVPEELRLGVAERVGPDGEVIEALAPESLQDVVARVKQLGPEAVALSLLFSFVRPDHEQQIAAALRKEGIPVSVSHEILPEFREYERTATITVNAFLSPLMGRYLSRIERAGGGSFERVRVMQSNGGSVSATVAAEQPVRTVLSGPAGGVVGASYVAKLAGCRGIVSFDMGGTSTDVALLEDVRGAAALSVTKEGSVGGLPVAVPMLDIHTVGAGGGSIAWVDPGGALRVGPQSAGADPGPICYGKGTEPTVTDAHLVLGRLDPEQFLGGSWTLDTERTRARMSEVAREFGFPGPEGLASGIVAVVNATMERAVRVISVERGHDPGDFTLVAFGGAGALHACEMAASLRIPRVLVPRFPGALSALGILRSDVVKDYSRTLLLRPNEKRLRPILEDEFRALERRARADLKAEGFGPKRQRLERRLDVRYSGQGFEITVKATGDFFRAFHAAHQKRYGYADPGRSAEVVGVRLRAVGVVDKAALRRQRKRVVRPGTGWVRQGPVFFGEKPHATDFFVRERMAPGQMVSGPAVVSEYSATTLIPPGWQLQVDPYGSLLLEPRGGRSGT